MYVTAASYLDMQLRAQGIPILGVSGPPWTVQYDPSATQAQRDQGDALAASFDGKARQSRPLWAIRGDIQALTTTQWGKVWADLSAASGPVPRKYLADTGPNTATVFCYDHIIFVVGGTTAQVKAGQVSLTACYVQDNPAYLIQPPFDQTINLSGLEPVP